MRVSAENAGVFMVPAITFVRGSLRKTSIGIYAETPVGMTTLSSANSSKFCNPRGDILVGPGDANQKLPEQWRQEVRAQLAADETVLTWFELT